MKKRILSIAALVVAFVTVIVPGLAPGFTAHAADATGDIGFYVRAALPDNQLDSSLTYFDLRMRPGQSQTLEVEIVNEADEPITVDIAAISASTNRNGVIDYKTPDIRDETLRHPFSELARPERDALDIPARSSATARITVTMPDQTYDGVVLGGLVFTRHPGGDTPDTQGMTLQNVYSYVIGVKLSETDTLVQPDFALVSVAGETVNYRPAFLHAIRNKNAAIAKGVDIRVIVRDAAGNTVADITKTGVDMAPNSTMPLAVTPGGEGAHELRPGDYTSDVTVEHDGERWTFEHKFTVGSVEADNINNEAVGLPQTETLPLAAILIIGCIAAVLIIALLVILLLLLLRRRTDDRRAAPPARG